MSGRRNTHNGALNRQSSSGSRHVKECVASENDENKHDISVIENKNHSEQDIWNFVLQQLMFSRCVLLIFQSFINWVMWDWTTDAFKGIQEPKTFLDGLVNFLIGGLSNWDARHFLHIAEFGYTYESELAFFPLFPVLLRIFGNIIHTFIPLISFRYCMIIAGVIISNSAFIVAGLLLYNLVYKITGSVKESLIAVYVYCWNPASVFFSNLYTESIYTMITFFGMYVLEQQSSSRMNQVLSAAIFSFAFMTRSNGILNIGYIGFALLIDTFFNKKQKGRTSHFAFDSNLFTKMIQKIPTLLLCAFIIILPLRIFSYAIEEKFCHGSANFSNPLLLEYGNNRSATFPGIIGNLSWCNPNQEYHPTNVVSLFMPSYYGAVQQKYWSVGFLQYWRLKKIPLFILASPTLGFVFYGAYNLFIDIISDKRMINHVFSDHKHPIPYALHSLFIAFCGIFVYNVETSIRLIYSSSPFIYLTLARLMSRQTPKVKVPDDLLEPFALPFLFNYACAKPHRFLILAYLLGYFTIGTLMHVNWLPFV